MLFEKPKIGDVIEFPTNESANNFTNGRIPGKDVEYELLGTVTRIDGEICYCDNDPAKCFIWKMPKRLNRLARVR